RTSANLARPMAASRAHRGHLRLVDPSQAERADGSDSRSPSAPDLEAAAPASEERRITPPPEEVIAPASAPAGEAGDIATPIPPPPPRRAPRPALRGPLANLPDAQLVALGCKGDGAAFELLYRRHVSFALHLATRIEGSSRDVEDIVHDA